MICIDSKRFPEIKQRNSKWCMPASIENVIKYHGGDLSQEQIIGWFEEKYGDQQIGFGKVKDILEEHYGEKFDYIIKNRSQGDFYDGNKVLLYAEKCLKKDCPLIISMWLPEYEDQPISEGHRVHMYIVYCIRKNTFSFFDTDPKISVYPRRIKPWIIEHLSEQLGTFLIIPKYLTEFFDEIP